MNIVYFGTPPLSANILSDLIDRGFHVVAIVTRPDKPRGRSKKLLPSAVKELAEQKWPHIPIFTPEKASTEEFVNTIESFSPDVFVVVSYGEIIKQNLLSVPQKNCINVHFSLLPKYRGAAPMQRSLMSGENETGITIIEMALKMDAGDILDVEKVPLDENITFGELEQKLSTLSGVALERVLQKISTNTLDPTPQDHSKMTLAPKISFEDRVIHWDQSAENIHNQIRGLSPLPGAFTSIQIDGTTRRLGVKKTKKVPHLCGEPGETLSWNKEEWLVACGEGALSLLEVQLEGKKPMSIQNFLRGQTKPLSISNS